MFQFSFSCEINCCLWCWVLGLFFVLFWCFGLKVVFGFCFLGFFCFCSFSNWEHYFVKYLGIMNTVSLKVRTSQKTSTPSLVGHWLGHRAALKSRCDNKPTSLGCHRAQSREVPAAEPGHRGVLRQRRECERGCGHYLKAQKGFFFSLSPRETLSCPHHPLNIPPRRPPHCRPARPSGEGGG